MRPEYRGSNPVVEREPQPKIGAAGGGNVGEAALGVPVPGLYLEARIQDARLRL